MRSISIGDRTVSTFILGGNPFSGFSHQTCEEDNRMLHYFSAENIKKLFRQAETLGINTLIARADFHICRTLLEYWDEGGTLQWFAQTCPELGPSEVSIQRAIKFGASAVYIHGGVMDKYLADGEIRSVQGLLDEIRSAGKSAGIAGHNPGVFREAEKVLDTDFYMCCHYNPSDRSKQAEHVHGATECFADEDRSEMTDLIQDLSRPVIHYKIMAAGRNDPEEAFAFTASKMRDTDAVCVGVFPKDNPDMLEQDVRLLEKYTAK